MYFSGFHYPNYLQQKQAKTKEIRCRYFQVIHNIGNVLQDGKFFRMGEGLFLSPLLFNIQCSILSTCCVLGTVVLPGYNGE